MYSHLAISKSQSVCFTFLLAKFIQYYILEEYEFLMILVSCFAVGIILHRVFCVKTIKMDAKSLRQIKFGMVVEI